MWYGSVFVVYQQSATPPSHVAGPQLPPQKKKKKIVTPLPAPKQLNYRATEFRVITHAGKQRVSGGVSPVPSQGAGHQNCATSYIRAHSMRNNSRILDGDQTIREEQITRSTIIGGGALYAMYAKAYTVFLCVC